jgi:hypothetical protein
MGEIIKKAFKSQYKLPQLNPSLSTILAVTVLISSLA